MQRKRKFDVNKKTFAGITKKEKKFCRSTKFGDANPLKVRDIGWYRKDGEIPYVLLKIKIIYDRINLWRSSQTENGNVAELAEGGTLLRCYTG